MRSNFLVCLVSLLAFLATVPAGADTLKTLDQNTRIERMAFAACMVMAELNPNTNAALAHVTADEFDADISASGLTTPTVLQSWQVFGPAVRQLAERDLHSIVAQQFLSENKVLGTEIGKALQNLAESLPEETKIRRILKEMQALSQTLAKDICLVSVNIDATYARKNASQALDTFEEKLLALEEGDDALGIPEPMTLEFEDTLWMPRGDWDTIYEDATAILEMEEIDRDEFIAITESIGMLFEGCIDAEGTV